MLLVKTILGPSSIHETGCFAAEFIKTGDHVWRLTPCDVEIPEGVLSGLNSVQREFIERHAWWDSQLNVRILGCDNAKYFNHSDDPNLIYPDDPRLGIASRDIGIGEEITEDYRSFDSLAGQKLDGLTRLW